MIKKFIAEFLGTAVLVIFGCGVAMTNSLAGVANPAGYVGIALAFGLSIVALAYSIGNVSGCHVNPAVSIAMFVNKKLSAQEFAGYLVSQFLGAIVGALILVFILGNQLGLGLNGYGDLSANGATMVQAFAAEVVLSFVFVFAICGVTSKSKFTATTGLVIGLTLTLVHLMGLPITGTSVNPARSFGPALVAAITGIENGAVALGQVWVFILAPLVGGVLAALAYKALDNTEE